MKRILAVRRETLGQLLVCLSRALFGALLAGARLFGGYAPFAVGAVAAAGAGWEGLFALIGAGSGALLFLDFPHALRTVACSMLLFTANNAFCELQAYRKRWFLPAMTAGLMLAVEAIYVVRSFSAAEASRCLSAILLASAFADPCRRVFRSSDVRREQPMASLFVLVGVLTALSAPEFRSGFAPGRIAAACAVLLLAFEYERALALSAALCIGLALDLAAPEGTFAHVVCYGFGALATNHFHRGSRVRAAAAFVLSAAALALPLGAREGLILLYESLAATLVFLLLPSRVLRALRPESAAAVEAESEELPRRMRETASALRELYDSVVRAKAPPEENPAVIFDRAAEAVCRDCPMCAACWEREYGSTYNALNDATGALLQNGVGRGEDFPAYFTERCLRFPSFLSAVNAEIQAFLLRRQYRLRLERSYARSAGQYARLSELLDQTAERASRFGTATLLTYQAGMTLRPKAGESVSGDCASVFETPEGMLCLLLSDGMGSGEAARGESALAVRLIERLLRAGVEARSALRTLNGALGLRAELSEGFTTVDLLTLSLKNGEGELYKYGAAPSYVKRGAQVRRVTCSCLPAGLAEDSPPEVTHLRLERGSFFVMVTDGVADSMDDAWLEDLIAAWEGADPRLLVSAILADSYDHKGTADDAGVLALYLPEDEEAVEV